MDRPFHPGPPEAPRLPGYTGGYQQTPYPADPAVPRWTPPPSPGYDGHSLGFRSGFPLPVPAAGGFGGPRLPPPFAFDPSVPPPPFGCPPPAHFPGAFQPFAPGEPDVDRGPRPPDAETDVQRKQDEVWVRSFAQTRVKGTPDPAAQEPRRLSVPELRERLYGAAALASRLAEACRGLRTQLEDPGAWSCTYPAALRLRAELEGRLSRLGTCAESAVANLARLRRRRQRLRRRSEARDAEWREREERRDAREAAIDAWRGKQVQRVEEKKKEAELRRTADAVLCEVRRKQADVKRMLDLLRSLEKLRRLRQEAASRKGILADPECECEFVRRLERLRVVAKKRTSIYSAEEKALRVMLEGEQEEERRREQERRMKKERERQAHRRRQVDAMLFGDQVPGDPALQPMAGFYAHVEHSLYALVHIRREWDAFLVQDDHPEGSAVPQSWVLPDVPSDPAWASALVGDGT